MPSPDGNIEAIEQALAALLAGVDGIENSLDHEPRELPKLAVGKACSTLMWRSVEPIDAETGPGEDVIYSWNVNLYVSLHDFQRAQTELKQLVPRVIALFRPLDQANLERLVDWIQWRDLDGEPVMNPKQGYIRKTLVATARVYESS